MRTEKVDNRLLGCIAAFCVAVLWSTMGLLIKSVSWNAMSINAARCLVAYCCSLIMRKGKPVVFNWNSVLAALCFVGETGLFVFANKYTTAGNATVLQYSSTFFIILLEWIVYHHKPLRWQVACAFGTVVGVALCCFSSVSLSGGIGNMLAVLGGLCYGGVLFFIGRAPEQADDANHIGFLLGAVVGMPSLLEETQIDVKSIVMVIALGMALMWLSYLLLETALKRITALQTNLICALEAVMSPIWAAVFLNENITMFTAVGGALILLSALCYSSFHEKRFSASSPG